MTVGRLVARPGWRRAAVPALALVTAGVCSPVGRPAAAAAAPADSGRVAHLHLGVDDSGRTVQVHPGDVIVVRLPGGPNGGYHWPRSTAAAVRRDSARGGYPSWRDTVGRFTAARPGTAHLVSTDDYRCLDATPPCLPPQRRWRVTVTVAPE